MTGVNFDMESSNPVLSRLGETARVENQVLGTRPAERTMTLDDVVLRTVALLVLTGAVGAVCVVHHHRRRRPGRRRARRLPGRPGARPGDLLQADHQPVRSSPRTPSCRACCSAWPAARSRTLYPGIVIQAVVGTFGVFFGMAVLYRLRVIRATPRFTRFVIGALIGVVALSLVNLVVYLFSGRQGLEVYTQDGEVGWLPIVFSLVCIGVGALTFILDFDAVEKGIALRAAAAVRLVLRVRPPGRPDLPVLADPAPAELPAPLSLLRVSDDDLGRTVDLLVRQVSHWEAPRWKTPSAHRRRDARRRRAPAGPAPGRHVRRRRGPGADRPYRGWTTTRRCPTSSASSRRTWSRPARRRRCWWSAAADVAAVRRLL